MILIATLLLALPLGLIWRQRTPALLTYVGLQSFLYTFQTMLLLRQWVGGDGAAFPLEPDVVPVGYGATTFVILLAGVGMVEVGHRLRARLDRRRAARHAIAGAAHGSVAR